MIKIYIASRYSIGNKEENVKYAMSASNELIKLGFAPFSPLLSHYQDIYFPQPYKKWLELDLEWLHQCDCLFRLPGESAGADLEEEEALLYGIPVFKNIEFFKEWSAKCNGVPEVKK